MGTMLTSLVILPFLTGAMTGTIAVLYLLRAWREHLDRSRRDLTAWGARLAQTSLDLRDYERDLDRRAVSAAAAIRKPESKDDWRDAWHYEHEGSQGGPYGGYDDACEPPEANGQRW